MLLKKDVGRNNSLSTYIQIIVFAYYLYCLVGCKLDSAWACPAKQVYLGQEEHVG